MKNISLLVLSILLSGCLSIPELKPGAESINVVTSADHLKNCTKLGLVYGRSDNGLKGYGGTNGVSAQHSLYDAMNKAMDLGADSLLLISTSARTGGSNTMGEALICKKPQ